MRFARQKIDQKRGRRKSFRCKLRLHIPFSLTSWIFHKPPVFIRMVHFCCSETDVIYERPLKWGIVFCVIPVCIYDSENVCRTLPQRTWDTFRGERLLHVREARRWYKRTNFHTLVSSEKEVRCERVYARRSENRRSR